MEVASDSPTKHPPRYTTLTYSDKNTSMTTLFRENLELLSVIFSLQTERVSATCLIPLSHLMRDFTEFAHLNGVFTKKKHLKLIQTQNSLTFLPASSFVARKSVEEKKKNHVHLCCSHKGQAKAQQQRVLFFYEKILYNPRRYNELPENMQSLIRQELLNFESSWNPLRFLCYLVQNHKSKCDNSIRWAQGNQCLSYVHFKYCHKCCCSYKQNISFFIPPLYIDLVPSSSIQKVDLTEANELQDLRNRNIQAVSSLKLNNRSYEEYQDNRLPANESIPLSESSLDSSEKPITRPQAYRQITPDFCLRSRPYHEKEGTEIDLVVFFPGKDMLAIDWLGVIDQCLLKQVAIEWRNQSKNISFDAMHSLHSSNKETLESGAMPRKFSAFDPQQLNMTRRKLLLRGRNKVKKEIQTNDDKAVMKELFNILEDQTSVLHSKAQLSPRKKVDSQANTRLSHTITCAFILVEYPGYGACFGLPSPTSCIDAGLETIRQSIRELNTKSIRFHCIGYSVGCAIALRVTALIAELISGEKRLNSNEPLSSIEKIQSLILIAPFTSSVECFDHLLKIPIIVQRMSSYFLARLVSQIRQYDNVQCIRYLARLISARPIFFSKFVLTIVVGSDDHITPEIFGIRLINQFKKELRLHHIKRQCERIHCVRIHRATHTSLLEPSRLMKIFIKYHHLFTEEPRETVM